MHILEIRSRCIGLERRILFACLVRVLWRIGRPCCGSHCVRSLRRWRRSWSKPIVLQENLGQANVMSVSLLRTANRDILFFYLVKNSLSDLSSTFVVRRMKRELERARSGYSRAWLSRHEQRPGNSTEIGTDFSSDFDMWYGFLRKTIPFARLFTCQTTKGDHGDGGRRFSLPPNAARWNPG